MKKTILFASTLLLLPTVVFAQSPGIKGLIESFGSLVNLLIPLVAALALLYFFWGLAKFILNSGNEETHEEGKEIMKWGIVSLFVITSIWGIVTFIRDDLGIDDIQKIDTPGF